MPEQQRVENRVEARYELEKRIAVVMYGGVSLAIYMGGVAKELLGVVRATAPAPGDQGHAGILQSKLSGVEKIYRRIASGKLRAEDPPPPLKASVTIDVISGTSAGGINGIFLAKALACDAPLDAILRLWTDEGDLDKLINDADSVADTSLSPDDPPAALLNGRRMYEKLADAFDDMDAAGAKERNRDPASRYDAGRVDLFVTTTDVRGETIRLAVSNATARERRHRQRFHFTFDAPHNDLERSRNPLLAFAARCTSSFPAAFEPFTWSDALAIAGERAKDVKDDWTEPLMFVGADYERRPLADGGYLDNKPFSYAVDELARRQSSYDAVARTLVYVEPDPEKFRGTEDRALQVAKPDAFENVAKALTMPSYETIREDLEAVIKRNERVEQLKEIEGLVQTAVDEAEKAKRAAAAPDEKSPKVLLEREEWTEATEKSLVEKYGPTYPIYHRIKVNSVIDAAADVFCSVRTIGTPENAQVIREVASAWLKAEYPSFADELKLLLYGDIDYRLRRISFLLRRAGDSDELRLSLKNAYDQFYVYRKQMKLDFEQLIGELGKDVLDKRKLADAAALDSGRRSEAVQRFLVAVRGQFDLKKYFEECLGPKILVASEHLRDALARTPLREPYESFENYDMAVYPIVRHGAVDEAARVDVLRVSPHEGTKRKVGLAGVKLGHFGAFLEEDWRRNDILCGRLDGAEVIVRDLASACLKATDEEIDDLVAEAHREIVADTFAGHPLPTDLPEKVRKGSRAFIASVRGEPLEEERSRRDPKLLLDLLREGKLFDLGIDARKQIGSAGRAAIVTERITRVWALKAHFPFPALIRWGVLMLALLGQIAIPRSLHRQVARYWGALLFLVFSFIFLAGYFGNAPALTFMGIKGALTVFALWLLTVLIASFLGGWLARLALIVIVGGAGWAAWRALSAPGELKSFLRDKGVWTRLDTIAVGMILAVLALAFLLAVVAYVVSRVTRKRSARREQAI